MAKTKATTVKQDCWRRIGVWGAVFPRCEKLAEVIHCRNCAVFIDAGRSVFERRVPANYRDQWTTKLLEEDVRESNATVNVFVSRIGNEWLALPAGAVDAIAEHKTIHRLPHGNNKLIAGLANIAGEILVCYSLEAALGIKTQAAYEHKSQKKFFRRFMVAKLGGNRYVFSVDEVRGMTRYDPASLKCPPDTISDISKKIILGTFDLDAEEITVLDATALGEKLEGGSE
jgi:chemotaxis-related protein WspD